MGSDWHLFSNAEELMDKGYAETMARIMKAERIYKDSPGEAAHRVCVSIVGVTMALGVVSGAALCTSEVL